MDSMIKEINENLKAIIDTMKDNLDNSINTLDNIQLQMDKKVEEAKKYKIQVDNAKERIKDLETENKSLELSLNEISDKYGKLNLVSVVEAGNREIKNKINDNLKEINKEKSHIADLTNKARTIKDLLINLKKDKTVKEERLENSKVIYNYYNDRINEIMDYAFDHSENLMDYKNNVSYINEDIENVEENVELENTMVFDEIANIDDNKNFKDEMTFINEQIDNTFDYDDSNIDDVINRALNKLEEKEELKEVEEPIDSTQVFDAIINDDMLNEETEEDSDSSLVFENALEGNTDDVEAVNYEENDFVIEPEVKDLEENIIEEETTEPEVISGVEDNTFNFDILNNEVESNEVSVEDKALDEENISRINKINDLFSNFENNTVQIDSVPGVALKGVEEKIDDAYMDIFGKPLEEDDLNKKEPTLTDIFGNPVINEELSNDTKVSKKIEELFVENGIDFNKFREDEKNYLKQIYEEEKFKNIIDVLNRNRINIDNIYNAFNIFGEITFNELENLINKLLSVGQSVEAIGLVLEKLPKVKKYNLDEAIMSYGEYVKNIDITELIIKAKELYKNGGNN